MKRLIFVIGLIALSSSLNSRMVSCALADDTLWCHVDSIYEPQGTPSGMDCSFIMNITENAAVPFPNQDVDITFTSPALVSGFTYGIINVTVCHTLIAEADEVQLHIYIGYYDASGYHIHNVQISDYLDVGSTITTYSVIDVMQLQAGQRLFVRAYLTPSGYSVFWGDTSHPTRVSYEGSGPYVPEFPSLLLLPLVITTTLLAVIVQEIKQRSKEIIV